MSGATVRALYRQWIADLFKQVVQCKSMRQAIYVEMRLFHQNVLPDLPRSQSIVCDP